MDTVKASSSSSSKPRPAPPPKPSHLSVAFTGTLNSDALRDYIKAQSTGGSTWSKADGVGGHSGSHQQDSDEEDDDEGNDVFGTAKVVVPSPAAKSSGSSKTPLRDIWGLQNKQPQNFANVDSADSDGDSDPADTSHSRYVSTVSTIKPSPNGKMGTVRTLGRPLDLSTQGTIRNLPVAPLEEESAQPATASSISVSKWLADTSTAQGTVRGHHDRADTSTATVRPGVPEVVETTAAVQLDTPGSSTPDSKSSPEISLDPSTSTDRVPRYSLASSADGLFAMTGERSRAPSILSRRDTHAFADWEMHDHSLPSLGAIASGDAGQPSTIKEDAREEEVAAVVEDSTAALSAAPPAQTTSPAGRAARALYPVQGEAAFNELSLQAGQTFRVLNEELQGGWSLAIVEDPTSPGVWIRGLVPRGWYALEREMAPPPPTEEEIAESRKNQDQGYLAPVVVKSSNVHAVAEPTHSEEASEIEPEPITQPAYGSPTNASSTLLSVSQFLSHPASGSQRKKSPVTGLPSSMGGMTTLFEETGTNAKNTGTSQSVKRQTRATAALSQFMTPSSSSSGGPSGSWFMNRSISSESTNSARPSSLKVPVHSSPSKDRKSPTLPAVEEPQVVDIPDLEAVSEVAPTPAAEQTGSQRDHEQGRAHAQSLHLQGGSETSSIQPTTMAPPPSSKLVTPFYRTVKRFSPFVTSGAEAYLLSRELGSSKPRTSGSVDYEAASSLESPETAIVRLQHPVERASDSHEIYTGASGELRWKEQTPPVWVDIHSPAYIEGRQSDSWLRFKEPGFVIYQVTSRHCETGGETHKTPLDPVLTPSDPTSTLTVSRRFKHFSQLSSYLTARYPLLSLTAIPPLPAKSHSKRFDATFLEVRRRELSNWLERITRHPVLRKDEVVHAFLTVGMTHGGEVAEGEEGMHEEWDSWIAGYQATERQARKTAGKGAVKDPAVEFFSHTFHPEFAIDHEEIEAEVKRAEEWTRLMEARITGAGGAKKDPEPLLKAVRGVREDLLHTSQAYRELGRSLLRATTGVGAEGVADLASKARNDVGGWCWRDGCTECVPLTQAMQTLSDTLQDVAQLHDEQARYHLMPFHERLWNTSQPHATTTALFDLYRSTLDKYALALKADASASSLDTVAGGSGIGLRRQASTDSASAASKSRPAPPLPVETAEHLASGSETVLSVLQSELQHMHDSRLCDWRKMGTSLLDEQIGFYEDVLGKLKSARVAFTDDEWRASETSAQRPSPYLDELNSVRPAPPPPLPQPTTQILPSSGLSDLLKPVGLAGEVVLGMFGAGAPETFG